jgi:hypothetical protein
VAADDDSSKGLSIVALVIGGARPAHRDRRARHGAPRPGRPSVDHHRESTARWRVKADDGDTETGTFRFTVR